MRYVSRKEIQKAERHGCTGTYLDIDGKHPDWSGRRTIRIGDDGPGNNMYIEGVSFIVVDNDDPRCPKEFRIDYYSTWWVSSPLVERHYRWFRSEDEAKCWAMANMPSAEVGVAVSLVE